MNAKRLVQIGGVINLLFVALHLSFWKMFDWQHSLASLSIENRAVMQVLNIHTAYVLAIFSILSFVFPNEMSNTKIGRMVGMGIAGFWILRAINEVVFWGLSSASSWVSIVVCLAVAALYLIPATHKAAIQK